MAVARALDWGVLRGRMTLAFGFQVNVGGEADCLATDTNDIG